MGALGDCELISQDFLGQPVNSVSTMALVLAGALLLRERRTKWVGWALVGTGVGSFVFHGPMPVWGEWAHDVTLSWLIVTVGGLRVRWEKWSHWPALVTLALVFALVPVLADPIAIALTIVVAGSILLREPTKSELLPLGLLGAAAVLGRLGATGWPLCEPASPWQLHAMWHVGAAIGVAWWASIAARPGDSALSQL